MLNFNHAFTRVEYRMEIFDKPLDHKQALLTGLNAICTSDTPTLNELRDWLSELVAGEDEPLEPPPKANREVVEIKRAGVKVYQLEKVRCGKNCKGCPHGPYWYGYQRRKGKLVSWYIGKDLEKEFKQVSGVDVGDRPGSSPHQKPVDEFQP